STLHSPSPILLPTCRPTPLSTPFPYTTLFRSQSLSRGPMTGQQIEAARVTISRHLKRKGKLWIRVFPHKPITKKPAEVRMGSGKDRKSTRLNSSHVKISYAVSCLKKKTKPKDD